MTKVQKTLDKNPLFFYLFILSFLGKIIFTRKEGDIIMRKTLVLIVVLFLLIGSAGIGQAWQGRMRGMNEPYGLLEDESDFLIHPAKIVQGQGTRFYGDYRFTYTETPDWDYSIDVLGDEFWHYRGSSDQDYKHNALVGTSFPLCTGRMGVFFSYDGNRADFSGHERYSYGSSYKYALDRNADNFSLNLIYGLPVKGFDLGMELGVAYRDENQENWINAKGGGEGTQNYIWSWDVPKRALSPFMMPYNSSYWELLWKAGISKKLSNMTIDLSARGGYILSSDSDNLYEYVYYYDYPGTPNYHSDMNGDVRGYRFGSDLWVRYSLKEGLDLPFLVSVDFSRKNRDGEGIGTRSSDSGYLYMYENTTKSFELKAGGGVEKSIKGCGRLGAGLYYNYLQNRENFWVDREGSFVNESSFPYHKEHRLILALAGEQELSSCTLRGGLNFYYGWVVTDDYKHEDINLTNDGRNWGIGASLGLTKKMKCLTLEPFVNGGFREFDVDGGGYADGIVKMKKEKQEWYTGAGLSILFDM